MQFLEKKNSVMRRQRKCQIGDAVGFNNQPLELQLLDMSGKWYSVLMQEWNSQNYCNSFNTVLDQLNKTYSMCMFKLTNNEKWIKVPKYFKLDNSDRLRNVKCEKSPST